MADLATTDDLEARLGRTLTATEKPGPPLTSPRRPRSCCPTGAVFDQVDDDTVILRPVGAYLVLPQTPVTDVSEVRGIDPDGVPGTALSGWRWDGLERVDITTVGFFAGEPWWPWKFGPEAFQTIYSHGLTATPEDVVGVVCNMVLRTLLSPSLVEGMTSERIGQYSYQLGQFSGGAASGVSVRLTEADKDALRSYRPVAGSSGASGHSGAHAAADGDPGPPVNLDRHLRQHGLQLRGRVEQHDHGGVASAGQTRRTAIGRA
jgi:hypothetical protein